jgi:hypothetical protein
MTVVSSRCPRAFTRRTQKPLSSLWNVTLSTSPEISSVVGLAFWDCGIHVWGFIFAWAVGLGDEKCCVWLLSFGWNPRTPQSRHIRMSGAHGLPDFIPRSLASPVHGSLKGAKGRFAGVNRLAHGLL